MSDTSPRVEWLRQAVRQLLFVFIPVSVLAIYAMDFHNTPYQHMYQSEMIMLSILVGIPVGFGLWLFYRIVRFAIGR